MNYWSPPGEQPFLWQPVDLQPKEISVPKPVWHPQFTKPAPGASLRGLAARMLNYPTQAGKKESR